MTWECVIGLEVHVQLGTTTKMFCAAASMRCSANIGAMICAPIGRPWLRPTGMLIAGRPARLMAHTKTSA